MYERIIAGPEILNARPGSTNNPELIIAPEDTANTSINFSSLFNGMSSQTFVKYIDKSFYTKEFYLTKIHHRADLGFYCYSFIDIIIFF